MVTRPLVLSITETQMEDVYCEKHKDCKVKKDKVRQFNDI